MLRRLWPMLLLFATAMLPAAALLLLAGCAGSVSAVRGNGVLLSEQRAAPPAPFDSVDLRGAMHVTIAVDPSIPEPAIEIRADENLIPLVTTEVRSGTLHIDAERPLSSRNEIRVMIVTPSLAGARISGSGDLMAEGIDAQSFTGRVSGSGGMTLAGRTVEARYTISGSGSIRARELEAQAVAASISGSGNISLHAREQAEMSISGSGSIDCVGAPARVRRRVTGSGSIYIR